MGVHIAYTAPQEALRDELRAYYSKLLDPETRAEGKTWCTGGVVVVHADCAGATGEAAP